MKKLAMAIIAIGVIVLACAGNEAEAKAKRQVATFDTTMGTFKIELYNDLAPETSPPSRKNSQNDSDTWRAAKKAKPMKAG